MRERPTSITQFVSKFVENKRMQTIGNHSDLGSFQFLADYGIMVGSMLTATLVEYYRSEGYVINEESLADQHNMLHTILQVARHVGNMSDYDSNKVLNSIYGTSFSACLSLGKRAISTARSGYNFGVQPRAVTATDEHNAQILDRELITKGVSYFHSPEGQELLQQTAIETSSRRCVLLSKNFEQKETTPFDVVVTLLLTEYLNTESPYLLGPAQLALESIEHARRIQPYPPTTVSQDYSWKMPQ